jgi:hypothetical protein
MMRTPKKKGAKKQARLLSKPRSVETLNENVVPTRPVGRFLLDLTTISLNLVNRTLKELTQAVLSTEATEPLFQDSVSGLSLN